MSVPRASCPSTIICSSASCTAATPYGSNGSPAGYGGGGANRLSVNDHSEPVVDSSTSSRSGAPHAGLRQNEYCFGKKNAPQVLQRPPSKRAAPSSSVK